MGNFFTNQEEPQTQAVSVESWNQALVDDGGNLFLTPTFDPWPNSAEEQTHWYSNGLVWPSLHVYQSYEVTLRHFGTVDGNQDFEYFTHIKVDSDLERVSSMIYEDAAFTKLLQIQNLDYQAPHPIFQEILVRPAQSGSDPFEYKCKFDRYLRPKESLTFQEQLRTAWNPPYLGGRTLFMGQVCLASNKQSYFAFKGQDQLQKVDWISYVDPVTREIALVSTLDNNFNIEPVSAWLPRSEFDDSEFSHQSCKGVKQILYRGPMNPTLNMGITF